MPANGITSCRRQWRGGGRPSVLNRYQDNTAVYPSLGSYIPEAKLFNCPASSFASYKFIETPGGQYSYQELYEHPANGRPGDYFTFSFNLDCSYNLLWNYRFNDNLSEKPFRGPGQDSPVKLLACDVFFFSNRLTSGGTILQDHWTSTHAFKKGGFRLRKSKFPYWFFKAGESDFATNETRRSGNRGAHGDGQSGMPRGPAVSGGGGCRAVWWAAGRRERCLTATTKDSILRSRFG